MKKLSEVKQACTMALIEAQAEVDMEYKPKIKKAMNRKGVRVGVSILMALVVMLSFSTLAFASNGGTEELTNRVKAAGTSVYDFLANIVLTAGLIALAACGLMFVFGSGRTAENAKSWMFRIAVGLIIVLAAKSIINWAAQIAGSTQSLS